MVDFLLTIGWFSVLVISLYLVAINSELLGKKTSIVWDGLRYYSRVIAVIVIAGVVYGLPQIRELLPDYGPITPFELFERLNTDVWAGLWAYVTRLEDITIIVVTITLAVSPILRPSLSWSLDKLEERAPKIIPNLLVACLFPAVIGYHTEFAESPELDLWSGLWAGFLVYMQWVLTYSLAAVLMGCVYWMSNTHVEGLQAKSDSRKILESMAPLPSILFFAGLIIGLIFLASSIIAIFSVLLFPISVAIKLLSDSGLGSYFNSTLAVTNFFIAASIGFLKLDEFLIARTRFSMLYAFLIIAVLLAFFDLNDSHRIRELEVASSQTNRHKVDLVKSFQDWNSARSFDATSESYPIYIVAAQGGGIYAAYHSARFLAAAQDMSPEFSNHLFAISGVSGGALGAATFSTLVAAAEDDYSSSDSDWFKLHTDKMLGQDFLTATVWTTLFTDLWSRLMPCFQSVCPGARLSRANTFEHTLERAWEIALLRQKQVENPFAKSVYRQWNPNSRSPALLLNTTEVETGENVVISSAGSMNNSSNTTIRWLSERAPNLDIRLSTAVGLSARFPGLAPAGWYEVSNNENDRRYKRRLVDGGYYDNSGVVTALSIIEALKPYAGNRKFVLISLNSITESSLSQVSASGLSELLSPLKTLESVRAARGKMAVEQAHVVLDKEKCSGPLAKSPSSCGYKDEMRTSILATEYPSPLGWQLSKASRNAIDKSVGNASVCLGFSAEAETSRGQIDWSATVELVRKHNSCLLEGIRKELQ